MKKKIRQQIKKKNRRPKESVVTSYSAKLISIWQKLFGECRLKKQDNLFVLYEYLYIMYKSVICTNEYLVFQQDEGCNEN